MSSTLARRTDGDAISSLRHPPASGRIIEPREITISLSGIWRILRRLEMSRLPASQRYKRHKERWKRYEKPTRLQVLKIYDRLNQKAAIEFVDYVIEKLAFKVQLIQTDNGAEFGTAFHWHVLDKGIRHVYIKPATPRLNGKVERSHRIDADEFYRMLDGVVVHDAKIFSAKL